MFKYHTFTLISLQEWTSMLFQLVEQSQGKSGTFWTSTIKTSMIKNTTYLPWLGSKDWNIDMLIHAIKPREKWYFQRYDLRKRRESKGMMMMKCIWFYTLFCVLFGNKNLIQKIKNHQFVAVTLIENMCFIAFWWLTALYQKHRSVRGNHTWVFDIFSKHWKHFWN